MHNEEQAEETGRSIGQTLTLRETEALPILVKSKGIAFSREVRSAKTKKTLKENSGKLPSREQRGVLKGSGDNR